MIGHDIARDHVIKPWGYVAPCCRPACNWRATHLLDCERSCHGSFTCDINSFTFYAAQGSARLRVPGENKAGKLIQKW